MKYSSILLALMLCFISCKKDREVVTPKLSNQLKQNLLSPNAFIVDTSAIAQVGQNSVSLSKSKITYNPKPGDILLGAISVHNPDGFLRRVITVAETADRMVCQTEQSNLNEAFAQLSIDTAYTANYDADKVFKGLSGTDKQGVFKTGSGISIKFQDNNSIANGVKFNGEIFINIPVVNIKYEKKKGSTLPERVLVEAQLNSEGSTLEITNNDEKAIQVGEKILTEFTLPIIRVIVPIATPIGVFPFPVPFSQKLVIKTLPLTISGKAKWQTLPKFTSVLGAKYENSTWNNLCTFAIGSTAAPFTKEYFTPTLILSANVKFLTPEYQIYPFKIDRIKSFFVIPNTLELNLQRPSPNYSLKYKLDVNGGVKEEFFTGFPREFSIKNNLLTQTILEGDWSQGVPVVLTTAPHSITTTSAMSGGDVVSNGGLPILASGVCWSTSPNPTIANSRTNENVALGSYSSSLRQLISNRTYYVKAYATNSAGTSYGAEFPFTTVDNSFCNGLTAMQFDSIQLKYERPNYGLDIGLTSQSVYLKPWVRGGKAPFMIAYSTSPNAPCRDPGYSAPAGPIRCSDFASGGIFLPARTCDKAPNQWTVTVTDATGAVVTKTISVPFKNL